VFLYQPYGVHFLNATFGVQFDQIAG